VIDYKALYLKLMNETEKAIQQLIEAQRTCEEMYLKMEDENNPDQKN